MTFRTQSQDPTTMTHSFTRADRQKAGERYAAAVTELHASLAELAVLDRLVGGESDPAGTHLSTFAAWQPEALAMLRHREFAPTIPDLRKMVEERRAQMVTGA